MRRTASAGLAAVLLLGLAACGDDDGTAPRESELSRAEVAALAAAFGQQATVNLLQPQSGLSRSLADAPAAAAAPWSVKLNLSAPCPQGGAVQVASDLNGDYDQAARSFALDASTVLTHQGCRVPAQGRVFTLDGDPSLTATSRLRVVNGVPTGVQTSSLAGGFRWAADDGRSGSCAVSTTSTLDYTAGTIASSGSICGTSFESTVRFQP